ncbi:o-succinylbenzoate synthase [Paeniglutamicibacter psychrophenolicus]|uniref:o-succinylbenzoate synthase n=1 Tax=Paeniglutamicibacter psychrophenolicus TaxID=257454 RepID=A0ABS4WCF9_9MICC|nr:o-succinylbenzoate synthase [Paeniglutamicibacter psychrophenolicus]MBP2373894.1 O-succinylbenzoate synthase [Paeniglutamicibacter psychrophenolicus]
MNQMPDLDELINASHVVSLPMTVQFRGVRHREAMLLHGPAGWGEFSPFLEYGPAEASAWLRSAIEAAWDGYPEPVRQSIPVNATLPAVGPERVEAVLASYDAAHTIKVKVAETGQDLAQDVARVSEVRRLFPAAAIRIDANAGWGHGEAMAALEALAGFGLQYAEQPVAGIDGLARVRKEVARRGLGVLIAADESVRKESDPLAVARAGAADLIVIKAQPLGGVRRALQVVRDAGLPAVVSSALDTSIGLRQGAALAAALPELPYACGLATGSLFSSDITTDRFLAVNGELHLRDIAADPDLLAKHAVPAERLTWWHQRLADCHRELLAANR